MNLGMRLEESALIHTDGYIQLAKLQTLCLEFGVWQAGIGFASSDLSFGFLPFCVGKYISGSDGN